jgi:hypothetical protein
MANLCNGMHPLAFFVGKEKDQTNPIQETRLAHVLP